MTALSFNVVEGLLSVLLPLLVPLADEIELASMENFDVNTMVAIAPHTVILAVASDLHPLIFAPKAKLCLDPVSQLSLQANTITKVGSVKVRKVGSVNILASHNDIRRTHPAASPMALME